MEDGDSVDGAKLDGTYLALGGRSANRSRMFIFGAPVVVELDIDADTISASKVDDIVSLVSGLCSSLNSDALLRYSELSCTFGSDNSDAKV